MTWSWTISLGITACKFTLSLMLRIWHCIPHWMESCWKDFGQDRQYDQVFGCCVENVLVENKTNIQRKFSQKICKCYIFPFLTGNRKIHCDDCSSLAEKWEVRGLEGWLCLCRAVDRNSGDTIDRICWKTRRGYEEETGMGADPQDSSLKKRSGEWLWKDRSRI